MKIMKTTATRCHILELKCTKFDFGWGSAPDPTGGAYSAPPNLLAGFKGLLLTKREEREDKDKGGERTNQSVPHPWKNCSASLMSVHMLKNAV